MATKNELTTKLIWDSAEAERRIDLFSKKLFGLNSEINNLGKNTGAGKNTKSIGENIVAGITTGINSQTQKAQSSIGSLVDGLVKKAKLQLGIRSPSLVFTQIGQHIVQGLNNGLSSGAVSTRVAIGNVLSSLVTNVTSFAASALPAAIGKSFEAERANRQLAASATQAGLAYQFLAQKSKEFADEGGLSIAAANKTEGLIAKLAREVGRPQDLDKIETALLDTASGRGLQVSQLETLVNAVISGSSDEPLNNAGLQDPGALAKKYADSLGKSTEALTKQEQVLSRFLPLMQQAETLSGANADRMRSLSGQAETASSSLENLAVNFGSGITNTLEFRDALKLTNDILKSFSTNVDDVQVKLGKGLTPKQIAEEEANKSGNKFLDSVKTGYTTPFAVLAYPLDLITEDFETANNRFLAVINGAKKRRVEALTDLIEGEQNLLQKQNEAAKKQDTFLNRQTFEDREKARRADEKKKLDERRKEFDKRFSNIGGLDELNQNRGLLTELSNNRDLFTAEEYAKRVYDVQKKINDEIDKGKKKVDDLGKAYKSVFDNLSVKTNSQNPFVQLFSDSRTELDKLKESIKGLPEELQKAAIASQQALNKNKLFETRLDNNLSAFDLRETANRFRSPQSDTLVDRRRFEEIVQNSISRGNFFGGVFGTYGSNLSNRFGGFDKLSDLQKRDIYEVEQLKLLRGDGGAGDRSLISRLARERVGGTDENLSLNDRLRKQLSIINSGVSNEAERGIADRRLIGLSSGLDPSQIKAELREQIAAANEREAVRKENYERELLNIERENLEINKKIAAAQDKLLQIAEKDGLEGLNNYLKITVEDKTSGGISTGSAGTQDDVRNNYFNE